MPQVQLNFNHEDDGLQLSATVNFPRQINASQLSVSGLAEWRHAPANMVTFNQEALEILKVGEKAKNLSKVGVAYMGLKARSNILLPYTLRAGKNGTDKVKAQLTKLFKALGATSVKFTATPKPVAVTSGGNDDWDRDDND